MSLDPISAVSDLIKTTIDKIFPDANQKAQAQAAFETLKATQDFQLLAGQLQVNLAEASSTNWWVAGWRPAVGWLCVCGLGIEYLLFPVVGLFGTRLPPVDFGTLMGLLIPILGVGTMRTVEKVKDAEGNR